MSRCLRQDVAPFPGHIRKSWQAQRPEDGPERRLPSRPCGRIGGVACVAVGVLDSRFFMGSMSTAVGDKITRAD